LIGLGKHHQQILHQEHQILDMKNVQMIGGGCNIPLQQPQLLTHIVILYPERVLSSTNSVYAFGAQLEEGSFATSYIKTVASTVTRTKSVFSYPTAGNINASRGSLVLDFNSLGFDTGSLPTLISIHDGTADNQILIQLTAANTINFKVISGGVDQVDISSANITSNTDQSVGIVWSSGYCNLYLDGVASSGDISATIPQGLTTINIGSDYNDINQFNGTIKNNKIYKNTLSDTKMKELTQ